MSDINLGPFRINPRGEIQPNAQYSFLDLVSYKGSTYLNINNEKIDGVASIGVLPTEYKASKYYMMIAAKGDQGENSLQYHPWIYLSASTWDYSQSDKIVLTTNYDENTRLNIINAYDGCCGMIKTNKELLLPTNSDYSIDFYCCKVSNTKEYYIYSFTCIQDGTDLKYIWNRSVYNNG